MGAIEAFEDGHDEVAEGAPGPRDEGLEAVVEGEEPQGAGAVPGPACYGNGGTFATVTDANLLLGYLDADNFLGGKRKLDRAASEAAIDRIAADLELSREETAAGPRVPGRGSTSSGR